MIDRASMRGENDNLTARRCQGPLPGAASERAILLHGEAFAEGLDEPAPAPECDGVAIFGLLHRWFVDSKPKR